MRFYGISYSPWSLRARWALQHHEIEHEYVEYVSMVTTPLLRLKLRDFSTPITVPILFDGPTALRESADIARWADARGRGSTLFADDDEATGSWTATADQIAAAGRVLTTIAVSGDREAMLENVPLFVPSAVRNLSRPMVAAGAWYLGRKFEFTKEDVGAANRSMRDGLERVANRLVDRDYLGESFSFCDIAITASLQFVEPARDWATLGEASRRCWTQVEYAKQFRDLLQWRSRLLDQHLPR